MRCFIGLGSNLGERRANLEKAAHMLKVLARPGSFRVSPIYENPAVVPAKSPLDWQQPFLNAVVEMRFQGSARDLLVQLQRIEKHIGREPAPRWAPRALDLDLLLFGDEIINEADLQVPHPGLCERSFVLDPLKDLHPDLRVPGRAETALALARRARGHAPLWMGILNLTPDSFSDGGELADFFTFRRKISEWDEAGVQIFDLGAESTRPGAVPVETAAEWDRLQPALEMIRLHFQGRIFRPLISVDTRHADVAEKALRAGADWINDVSGLTDLRMVELLTQQRRPAIMMHALGIPANPTITLPMSEDPVVAVKGWAWRRLEELTQQGLQAEDLIFDPGIGFGKNAHQSLHLLQRWAELADLPVRLLAGHSRKSFLQIWSQHPAGERDWESVGVSLSIAQKGAEIIRVHEPVLHMRAHQSFQEVQA